MEVVFFVELCGVGCEWVGYCMGLGLDIGNEVVWE